MVELEISVLSKSLAGKGRKPFKGAFCPKPITEVGGWPADAGTLIASCAVAVCGIEGGLDTCTVNVYEPAVVGTPLITPVELFRLRPGGKLPDGMLQSYGGMPPETPRVAE